MRKRKILLISLIVLVACGGIIIFLPSIFRNQISNLLRKEINDNLVGTAAFSSADVNLWRNFPQLTVTLAQFSISGDHEFKSDTLVKIKSLHLVFGAFDFLIHDKVNILELNLFEPDFHVILLKSGKANYDIARKSDSTDTQKSITLDIESCEINNADFLYEDHDLDLILRGNDVSLTGVMDIENEIYDFGITAVLKKFTLTQGKKIYIQNKAISFDLQADYDYKKRLLRFNDNAININHLKLGIGGLYELREDGPYFDITFHADDADFKDLLSLNDHLFSNGFQGIEIKGVSKLEGNLKGIYNEERNIIPTFNLDFQVHDGVIKYDRLSSSINDINFEMVATNTDSIAENSVIDIKNFKLKLGDNPIAGSVKILGFRNGHIKSDIRADIALEDLRDIYPLEGISVDGKLELDLKAEGKYSGSIATLHKNRLGIVPQFSVALNIKDGTFKYDRLPESIDNIHFHLNAKNTTGTFENTSLHVEKLEALLGDNPIKGFIHLDGLKDPDVNADIRANIDLSEIKNFYPMEGLSLAGRFGLDMKLFGKWQESAGKFPVIDARVNIRDASLKSDTYPFPIENAHLKMEAINTSGNLRDMRVRIDSLTYTIENESFDVNGYIMNMEKYAYHLNMKGILYLEKLSRILQLNDNRQLSGEIDVDLRTSGNYLDLSERRYHKLPTTGKIILRDVSVTDENLAGPMNIKSGHLSFSNEKVVLDTLYGSIGTSDFNLSGNLSNYLAYFFKNEEDVKGDLLLTSDTLHLDELMAATKVSHDSTRKHTSVVKIPEHINITFDTKIRSLIYNKVDFTNVTGEASLHDGMLTLRETSLMGMGATFKLAGDYDTRNMEHPYFDLDVDIQELDISKAHDAFATVQVVAPAADDTYGIFSVEYKIKGELTPSMYPVFESLEGGGILKIREAKINGMKVFHHISGITKKEELKNPELKDIVMETTVDDGVIYVKPFSMKLAGFDTDIEGKHNMNGDMNYIVRMALPPFDIVKIPLHVNGTYDNPKIHLGKGHEEMMKKISEASTQSH